jgi:uncharacterized membrane protein YwaF
MQSMLYHASLGFAALMLPYLDYRPDVRNARKAYFVLILAGLATGVVNVAIGSNYLYTARLPLPHQIISWPYYLPLLLVFVLLAGRLPYYAYRIAETHAMDTASPTDHSA